MPQIVPSTSLAASDSSSSGEPKYICGGWRCYRFVKTEIGKVDIDNIFERRPCHK